MRRHDAVPLLAEMTEEEEGLAADESDCGSTTVVSELHPYLFSHSSLSDSADDFLLRLSSSLPLLSSSNFSYRVTAVVSVDLDLESSLNCGPKQDGEPSQIYVQGYRGHPVSRLLFPQRRRPSGSGGMKKLKECCAKSEGRKRRGEIHRLTIELGLPSLKMLTMEERRKQRYESTVLLG